MHREQQKCKICGGIVMPHGNVGSYEVCPTHCSHGDIEEGYCKLCGASSFEIDTKYQNWSLI